MTNGRHAQWNESRTLRPIFPLGYVTSFNERFRIRRSVPGTVAPCDKVAVRAIQALKPPRHGAAAQWSSGRDPRPSPLQVATH
ncbi:hypothetical protein B5X24_HaOG216821 [Helicoverpa armigera]|nr:hypothetical protein B5X24_HaOG216821 [Helicoverpa armigera]